MWAGVTALLLDEKTSAQPRSRVGSPHCEAACARSGLAHANAARPQSKSGPAHANALQPALPRPCMQKQLQWPCNHTWTWKSMQPVWGKLSSAPTHSCCILYKHQTRARFRPTLQHGACMRASNQLINFFLISCIFLEHFQTLPLRCFF